MDAQPHEKPKTIYLKDYRPPDYRIDTANLQFELDETKTRVKSLFVITSNYDRADGARPLVLDGNDLKLRYVKMDGTVLETGDYTVDEESLTIPHVPEQFTLEIETEMNPRDNTSLSGLYLSGGSFFTQCEAEGFRKITYFIDRPDNMTQFLTTVIAGRSTHPVLLSNGNPEGIGELDGNRHFATWHDPFPKPSYLFALVAGDLARVDDVFITMSGSMVKLHLYVQRHNIDKCGHAMASLKRAMKWDEEVYGREYDLDVFMIVAVDDFNMGAMENKGLNIFNSKYVLANPQTATDTDFQNIEGVVAHEYFHNWSGDRVTCRDWFQLSLKEGFTVFRDQHYLEDVTSRGVRRIGDVNILRTHQFREDAGPMAHPVRPESYVEINNFYTLTVYNKGAEVVGMLRTLLGPQGFRGGTDLYFDRHDGKAATTDDFVRAMEDANSIDLSQFTLWYSQAGTPELHVARRYDIQARTYTFTVRQTCPPTPGQPEKKPMHIPFAIGLLDKDGNELPLILSGDENPPQSPFSKGGSTVTPPFAKGGKGGLYTRVLELRKEVETFLFTGIPHEPVPSLLRGFSAPVRVQLERMDEELLFLMAYDTDEFTRWDAGQQLAVKFIMNLVEDVQTGRELTLSRDFINAFKKTLESTVIDKAFLAMALTLPSETYLADFMAVIDPTAIYEARRFVQKTLAGELKQSFVKTYEQNNDTGPYRIDQESIAQRSLRNLCLAYLAELAERDSVRLCVDQFLFGGNMTNVMAGLVNLANMDCPERGEALAYFSERWKHDPLVMDKWLAIQATSRLPDTLDVVKGLMEHPAFTITNPNKVRALIGAFSQGNALRFHEASGAGYVFLADRVLQIDALNPQIAARLVNPFTQWKRYDEKRKALMQTQLERIEKTPKLSKDVYEVVSKSLA